MDQPATTEQSPQTIAGLLAEFTRPEELVRAAGKVREAGYKQWDSHSPFAVHGIDPAMGIRPTLLPWLAIGAGLIGLAVAIGMQWWTNAVDYPLNISGKPLWSLPANIPIAFELVVLFSALTVFLGALALNGLPNFNHPLLAHKGFRRASDDRFFISIDVGDAQFDESQTRALLESLEAVSVEAYYKPARPAAIPNWTHALAALTACLALIPPLVIVNVRLTKSSQPRLHLWPDMDFQPKFKTQTANPWFDDLRTMRPPVAETVAVDRLDADDHFYRGKVDGRWATTLPIDVDGTVMERGRERYGIYCASCHGLAGDGDGIVKVRSLDRLGGTDGSKSIMPATLHNEPANTRPVGHIFGTITDGTIADGLTVMPAHGRQIAPRDRWAIVLYVRALQRSREASTDRVPADVNSQLE